MIKKNVKRCPKLSKNNHNNVLQLVSPDGISAVQTVLPVALQLHVLGDGGLLPFWGDLQLVLPPLPRRDHSQSGDRIHEHIHVYGVDATQPVHLQVTDLNRNAQNVLENSRKSSRKVQKEKHRMF